ncbi:hypothetical protein A2115_00170 [Candidatus Woesebacteria bacterium GWA1_41_8]|uniref:Uncharacterized protein n=1 Tax=Candidatus Woesebacteria bacterium GWA1_41_8 TaxID=1802471 RepID=A0A1F7WIF9_9BACT|nr:MAG: hypothetical protein A2115_00170 [Candidatus Woesebacteria bacterium GWA1_41_8]
MLEIKDKADSLTQVREGERFRVKKEAEQEMGWWGDQLLESYQAGLSSGRLIKVPQEFLVNGLGYRLIYKIRSGQEPGYLSPVAFGLLRVITKSWDERLRDSFAMELPVFLSVTSLYRDPGLQNQFIKSGMNALPLSAHQAGMAIDLDPNGYYQGQSRASVGRGAPEFNEGLILSLGEILEQLKKDGLCNVIYEKAYEENGYTVEERLACVHICVSPRFLSYE